jgi:hypothetical protein
MTNEEQILINEIRTELDGMIRRYSMHLEIHDRILKDLKQLKQENELLRAHIKLN